MYDMSCRYRSLVMWYLYGYVCYVSYASMCFFFFSSRRRHTRCALVTGADVCSSDLMTAIAERFAVDVGIHGIPVPRKVRVGERSVVAFRHHQERSVDRDALRLVRGDRVGMVKRAVPHGVEGGRAAIVQADQIGRAHV